MKKGTLSAFGGKKIALFSAVAILTLPTASVFAQNTTTQTSPENREQMRAQLKDQKQENRTENTELRQEKREEKRLEFQDKKEKMDQQRCQNIASKISNRTKRYENNDKMLHRVYDNMQARLARLVERLDALGADTSMLKTDIATLNGKIDKLYADQKLLIESLASSENLACTATETEFKGKFEQARNITETIKADRAGIKKYFQTSIKNDLKALRGQLATEKEPTEEEKLEAEKTDPATVVVPPAVTTTTPAETPTTVPTDATTIQTTQPSL